MYDRLHRRLIMLTTFVAIISAIVLMMPESDPPSPTDADTPETATALFSTQ